MKHIIKLFIGVILAANFIACSSQGGKKPKLDTHMDTVSYAIGLWIATGPANVPDKSDLDIKIISSAISDAFEGNDTTFSQTETQEILRMFSMDQQKKQQETDALAGEAIKVEGEEFLVKNKDADGIIVTASGLQYRIIKEGEGAQPLITDKVKVHYTGKLLNGDVFDSSHDRGQPAEFPINGVIPGWIEGLQLMKEGAVYEFFIPSDLAYGPRGAGEKIKPHATLNFEVELIEVIKQEVPATPIAE